MKTIQQIAADIAEELRQHPDRWTTGCTARDQQGNPVASDDDTAVCWCLMGHIRRRAPSENEYTFGRPFFLLEGLDPLADEIGFSAINDGRRVEEIISLCERVAASN
jgi:hypothetical protein